MVNFDECTDKHTYLWLFNRFVHMRLSLFNRVFVWFVHWNHRNYFKCSLPRWCIVQKLLAPFFPFSSATSALCSLYPRTQKVTQKELLKWQRKIIRWIKNWKTSLVDTLTKRVIRCDNCSVCRRLKTSRPKSVQAKPSELLCVILIFRLSRRIQRKDVLMRYTCHRIGSWAKISAQSTEKKLNVSRL